MYSGWIRKGWWKTRSLQFSLPQYRSNCIDISLRRLTDSFEVHIVKGVVS